jgi:hypothetical protein
MWLAERGRAHGGRASENLQERKPRWGNVEDVVGRNTAPARANGLTSEPGIAALLADRPVAYRRSLRARLAA